MATNFHFQDQETRRLLLKERLMKHASKHGLRSLKLQLEFIQSSKMGVRLPDRALGLSETIDCYIFAIKAFERNLRAA